MSKAIQKSTVLKTLAGKVQKRNAHASAVVMMVDGKHFARMNDGRTHIVIHDSGMEPGFYNRTTLEPADVQAIRGNVPEMIQQGSAWLEAIYHATINPQLLLNVSRAVTDDESRYFMTGVYFDAEENRVVATDGRRLHMADLMTGQRHHAPSFKGAIVPFTPAFLAGLKLIERSGTMAEVKLTAAPGKVVRATLESQALGFAITVTCIDGQFPNYKRVIPERVEGETLALPAKHVLSGFEAARKAKKLGYSGKGITFEAGKVFLSEAPDTAIDGATLSLPVKFNVDYLTDMVESGCLAIQSQGEQANTRMSDWTTKAFVGYTATGEMTVVLMPMPV